MFIIGSSDNSSMLLMKIDEKNNTRLVGPRKILRIFYTVFLRLLGNSCWSTMTACTQGCVSKVGLYCLPGEVR